MTTTQFQGESNWDAIVNDNALDIEEEQRFLDFIHSKSVNEKTALLAVLEDLFEEWEMFERSVETLEVEYKGYKILLKRVETADAYVYKGDNLLHSILGQKNMVWAEHYAQKWIDNLKV